MCVIAFLTIHLFSHISLALSISFFIFCTCEFVDDDDVDGRELYFLMFRHRVNGLSKSQRIPQYWMSVCDRLPNIAPITQLLVEPILDATTFKESFDV